jgi:hypothetical protein
MATLTTDEIADLVTTTQKELGRLKWTDLTGDLQEYIAMPQLLKKEKVQFDGGQAIQWNFMVDDNGQARNTGLYEVDNYNVNDVMKTASIPWRHTNTNYAIDEREIAINGSAATKIVDLVKVRRVAAMVSLAKLMETDFWGKPASSADEVAPYGVDYWVVKNATEGFNGGIPSGFTDVAGLSPTTYPRWKNWTAEYTSITKPDLVTKMRAAATKTMFRPPVDVSDYNRGNRFGYYTNYDVVSSLETLVENQNENLGKDVASMDGAVMFRRNPVVWVPELDSDSQDPVYGLNWGVFCPVFLKGYYMKEDKARQHPNQHNSVVTDIDTSYNWKCTDRRRLFIINKA